MPGLKELRIGVDLGGTKIEAVVLDPGGRELGRRRMPTPAADYEATVHAIAGPLPARLGDAGSVRGAARLWHPEARP